MLSSTESGADPAAGGRAFSTESSAASGHQSLAPTLASILPPHLQWNGQPLRYFIGTGNHIEIAAYYTAENAPDEVVSNVVPLSTIVARLGGDAGGRQRRIWLSTLRRLLRPTSSSSQAGRDRAHPACSSIPRAMPLSSAGPRPELSCIKRRLRHPSGCAYPCSEKTRPRSPGGALG
jgi:hypothetical protein